MHPQLTDKRIGKSLVFRSPHIVLLAKLKTVCKEFIAALEECHAEWWGARFTGACNQVKRELNLCLRKEVRCLFLAYGAFSWLVVAAATGSRGA
jgi:Cytochrome c oxidase biogenesis protein Cmc1 like